jgi:hypothetical protein
MPPPGVAGTRQHIVVLQELGPQALPERMRPKCRVIYQSTTARKALTKPTRLLRAVMVGHLREEKDPPTTLFAAARLLADQPHIRIDHIGAALDPALGEAATATMAATSNYRWLGGLPHAEVRRRIQRADVLVHAAAWKAGPTSSWKRCASGTPVLASRIDGNVGMLGARLRRLLSTRRRRKALAALLAASAAMTPARGNTGRSAGDVSLRSAGRAPRSSPGCRTPLRQLVADLLAAILAGKLELESGGMHAGEQTRPQRYRPCRRWPQPRRGAAGVLPCARCPACA